MCTEILLNAGPTINYRCAETWYSHFALIGTTSYSVTDEREYEECLSNSNPVTTKITANVHPQESIAELLSGHSASI